ncbi:MAG TPA: PAS domain S-box protein [Ktedonobacteraceae bacterium]|nr:PAS domain S-box protein [Ktedonobacteraceae bacterium]
MNTTIESTLLGLCQQVIADPDHMPIIPLDAWPEGTEQQQLLNSFRTMLECLQQHYQDKLEATDITSSRLAEQQLREKEEQYRAIFEATSDGLIIRDMDGFVVEANPAAYTMHGYTYQEFIGLHRTDIIAPEDHSMVAEYMKAIQAGRTFRGQAVDVRKDGTAFPVEVRGSLFTFLGKPHTLSVLRDITERVQAEQQLREKEEEYRSIFETTNDALFIMNLEDGRIIEANPAACNIYGYSYEEFIGLQPSAFIHPDQLPTFKEKGLPLIRAGGKRHIQGVNLRKDGSSFPIDLHQTAFTYQGKPQILSVMRDITEQVQAQQLLEQRVEERTRELSTLLEVSHNVASTLELKSLLGLILEQLKTVADYDGATITLVDGEHLVIIDYRGYGRESMLGWRFPLKQLGLIWETICRQEVVIVEDIYADTPLALAYRQAVGDLLSTVFAPTRTWMAIPMMLKERVMGMLNLSSRKPNYFTARHATLALGIAAQAAVAIENARLYEQAQELAAVEERQRLARELHDSVSQALYGISLGVHTARLQLDHNSGELAESLDYVLELAEAALTEMRALIFELRPASLEAEGLITALTKQATAIYARYGINVELDLCNEPDVPPKVKRELYRVAQEALHNTVKHAEAGKVNLRLRLTDGVVVLEVRDDGKGFEAAGSFPGHLGLHSMRERIESLDGGLQIESVPGQGTSICAHIPVRKTTNLNGV